MLLFLGLTGTLHAQEIMLAVEHVAQEETEWCSAASSQCVLRYYSYYHWEIQQCEIVEYARKNSFSHNYGTTPCCIIPCPPPCNQGASTVGGSGSIQDILVAFGGIVQEVAAPPLFSIIPNPNAGFFQLKTNFPLYNIAHFKITNSLGATIYETQHLSSNIIQLPTSASGLHFVVIILKDGAVLTKKMMIQR